MPSSWFTRAGDLRTVYESVDWAATPLGPPESWSALLWSTLDLAWSTRFAVTVFWGPQQVLLYNDAYVPLIADKHPAALGARTEQVFPEVWDTIGPMIAGVAGGGPTVWVQDAHLPLVRRGGHLQDAWFTFSYSPVRNAEGHIEGVIDIAAETTAQVLSTGRLGMLAGVTADLAAAEDEAQVASAVLGRGLSALGCGGGAVLVLSAAAQTPEGPWEVLDSVGNAIDVPAEQAAHQAAEQGALVWVSASVDASGKGGSARALGLDELAAGSARGCNPGAGDPPQGDIAADISGDVGGDVTREVGVQAGGGLAGQPVLVTAVAVPLVDGHCHGVLVATWPTPQLADPELSETLQALATQGAQALHRLGTRRQAQADLARIAQVTESMAVGYLAMDRDWRITYANTEAVHALGLAREQILGAVIWELFPAVVGSDFEAGYRRVAQTGEQVVFEAYYPAPLDAWYEVRATPEADGVALYFIDITARHHAQAAVQTAGERLSALGRIALALSDAEDVQALVAVMAEQGLAALGAAGGSLAVPDTEVSPQTSSHFSTEAASGGQPQLLSYITTSLAAARADFTRIPQDALLPVALAARTQQRVLLADEAACAVMSTHVLEANRVTGCQAWASLPLMAGGRLLGVLTAGWTQPQSFDDQQLELLETYAAQCSQALQRLAARDGERAARAAEQAASAVVARFSETVQRSLLTSATTPAGLQVAVRYVPAAAEAYVGGDWYDAFTTRAGVTTVVIGDVAGHDRNAAAAMAQLRNLLRGIGYTVSEPPAAVLKMLDQAAAAMAVQAMATCVLATVEQTPQQRAGGVRTLRWSNAGHPAPLLLRADSQVRYLDQEGTDLVIGIDPDTARHDHEHVLGAGDVVVLFTDGLIERRRIGLDVGLAWLGEAVAAWARLQLAMGAPLDPEALCDALLAQVEGHSEDDVALLVLRADAQEPPSRS